MKKIQTKLKLGENIKIITGKFKNMHAKVFYINKKSLRVFLKPFLSPKCSKLYDKNIITHCSNLQVLTNESYIHDYFKSNLY